ncbi:MAG: pirin family protein [Niabella sp.]|nr:pirin family protein [Niabella sp.]
MQVQHFKASERGVKDAGWLKSNFVFSFSNYYNPVKSAFGTLMAFNDDYLAPGKGFGIHPHVNMEIISILLKGRMNHKDTLGYNTEFEEGGVQIMSAGSGLRHEEYNIGEEQVNFLQIWIYPKQQNITPRYQYRSFPKEARKNQLVTIVSGEEGQAHCWINQNAKLSLGYFEKDHSITYSFNPENKCLFVFVISGSVTVNGVAVPRRDALGVWDTDTATIRCNEESEYLVIETVVNQK